MSSDEKDKDSNSDDVKVKHEPSDDMDTDDGETPQAFGPAALGLHPVGTKFPVKTQPPKPVQILNARGMPARIRKKNKLFFDDDIINGKIPKPSPKKVSVSKLSPIKTPSKILKKRKGVTSKYMRMSKVAKEEKDSEDAASSISLIDKKASQRVGLSLRNLLKLPKAHKFVSHEWFYSNIDKALFDGENDFQFCLKDMFPALKTRNLTRIEWNIIRRMLGKPRRCSPAFFEEERKDLERKRQKIRLLQTKKAGDVTFVRDLPNEIPLPLSVGTKVTARLRTPQDGLFIGTVEAVDTMQSAYRISFDRPGIGIHNIPDYEILGNDVQDTISLKSITKDFRPKYQNANFVLTSLQKNNSSMMKGDPLLGGDSYPKMGGFGDNKSLFPRDNIGGFPIKLLELIVRSRKTLSAKQMKLLRLQNMNSEAEIYKSYGDPFPDEYQKRYASLVLGMEKLNRDMQDQLNQLQQISKGLIQDPSQEALLSPSFLREKCREQGDETFDKNNNGQVTNENMVKLIKDLATIMYVSSNLNNTDQYTQCLKVLQGCMEETKSRLDYDNLPAFHRSVQVHLRHVEMGYADSHQQIMNHSMSAANTTTTTTTDTNVADSNSSFQNLNNNIEITAITSA